MKSARELFEELGFDLVETTSYMVYYYNEENDIYIWFYNNSKTIEIVNEFTLDILQAINQQVNELGWKQKEVIKMNLWVRSQDKRILQKVDNIFLDANYENKRISTYDGDNVELGTYKTKERALEVLDEIQDLLQNAYIGNSNRIVYEMPKE